MSRKTDAMLKALRSWGLSRFPGAHTKSPWPGHLDLAAHDKTSPRTSRRTTYVTKSKNR
jgi:hypothetical protein